MFTHDGILDKSPSIHGPRVDGAKIQVFPRKSLAVAAARKIGLSASNVCPLQTRFQVGYGVFCNLGRGYMTRQTPLISTK
jgi:hypothetical protein